MYVIIKNIKNGKTGKTLPVVLIDSQCEVLEFETEEEANKYKEIFQVNSDSNHQYEVKKV